MGIGVILSNQSLTDLEAVDANLISAVRTNTRYRQIYGVGTREDIRDIRDTAGESLVGMRSWQILPQIFGGPAVQSMNVRETPVPRMMLNDILLATDAFGRCISCLRRGADYAQFGGMPFVMDTVHHIPRRKYTDLRVQDWPPANEGCPVSGLEDETQIKVIGGPLGRRPAIETSSDDETVPDTPAQTETTDAEEAESDWNSRMEQEAEKEELDRKEKKARRQRRKKLDDENDPEFPPEGIR